MDFTGFYHEPKGIGAYPLDLHTLRISLRTGHNAAEHVTLLYFDPYNWIESPDQSGHYVFDTKSCVRTPMRRAYTANGFDYWQATAHVPTKRVKYAFLVTNVETYFYGYNTIQPFSLDSDIAEIISQCYIYPYILEEDIFRAPSWVKDTVWYQIFPARYGTGLSAVAEQLEHLSDLGITGLYFTPIFTSPSVHKYNTEDYFQIDPAFGNHEDFGALVRQAHTRGIKIMLDLVFNHIGSTHPFWRDVLAHGKNSRYYDCFYIQEQNGTLTYETFAKEKRMPKWNTGNAFARQYLLDVAVYWARTYGIDGFRLDVANEVSHDFWRVFRSTIRSINPDSYIVGEVWEHAGPWLLGDQFDGVMNYELTRCIWDFVSGKTNAAAFRNHVSAYLVSYPVNVQEVLFNLLGSHDTGRIMTTAKHRVERVIQAFTVLMTMAGSPCILYGDEIGLTGKGANEARQPMLFDDSDEIPHRAVLMDFLRRLIALRATHPAFKTADVYWYDWREQNGQHEQNGQNGQDEPNGENEQNKQHDRYSRYGWNERCNIGDDIVAYEKRSSEETIAVLLNGRDEILEIDTPSDWVGRQGVDLLHGASGERIIIQDTLTLQPYGVRVLSIPTSA